jgi:hypothetical protein
LEAIRETESIVKQHKFITGAHLLECDFITNISEFSALSSGMKGLEPEADHPPPTSAEVKKIVELYNHFLLRLHSEVLN